MADNIFECPFCLGHFLVPSDAAGGRMLCPHCREVLELRGLLEATDSMQGNTVQPLLQAEASKNESIVTDCPNCTKKFQLLSSMFGQLVACPHCQARLSIPAPTSTDQNLSDLKIPRHELSPAASPASSPTTESQIQKSKRKSREQVSPNIFVSEAISTYDVAVANESSQTGTNQNVAAAGLTPEKQGDVLDPELAKLLPPKFIVPLPLQ